MTLSVTLERFFAIAYPLKKLDLKRPLILLSIFGSIFYNLPRFFELKMERSVFEDPYTGVNRTVSSHLTALKSFFDHRVVIFRYYRFSASIPPSSAYTSSTCKSTSSG
jgi:hypothetical protein